MRLIRLDDELGMAAEVTEGVRNEILTPRGLTLDNGREVNSVNGENKRRRRVEGV